MVENMIVFGILICIIGGIVFYLYKAKKKGQVCVGCPCSKQCAAKGKCNHHKK